MATIFSFTKEPSGSLYRALLDACVDHCATGSVVVRPSLDLDESGEQVIEQLRPWIREEKKVSEWPGTKLHGHSALLLTFIFDERSAETLKEVSDSLYQWRQPSYPEDLCLMRPSGEPWLVTIAHERDGYLKASEGERDRFVEQVPELGTLLRYG